MPAHLKSHRNKLLPKKLALPKELDAPLKKRAAALGISQSHLFRLMVEGAHKLDIPLPGVTRFPGSITLTKAPSCIVVRCPDTERFLAGARELDARKGADGSWHFALNDVDEVTALIEQAFGPAAAPANGYPVYLAVRYRPNPKLVRTTGREIIVFGLPQKFQGTEPTITVEIVGEEGTHRATLSKSRFGDTSSAELVDP